MKSFKLLFLGALALSSLTNYAQKPKVKTVSAKAKTTVKKEAVKQISFNEVFQNIETAKDYLDKGGNPNVKQNGETALVYCICTHKPEIAELLIHAKGIKVNDLSEYHDTCTITRTAITVATEYPKIIKLLINEGANPNFQEVIHTKGAANQGKLTALMKAIIGGNHESSRILVENGIKLDIQDAKGNTALMHATNHLWANCKDIGENIEDTKLLIDNDANLDLQNSEGMSALMITASKGLPKTAKLLIGKGANMELQSTKYGTTALQWAVTNVQTEMIKLLLKSGAKVDGRDYNGETALMQASRCANLELVELVLEKGADVNSQSYTGQTPLMYVISSTSSNKGNERIKIIKLLIKKGAQLEIQDKNGNTALYWAQHKNDKETSDLLLTKGAKSIQ